MSLLSIIRVHQSPVSGSFVPYPSSAMIVPPQRPVHVLEPLIHSELNLEVVQSLARCGS